jgi:hypothetical protein
MPWPGTVMVTEELGAKLGVIMDALTSGHQSRAQIEDTAVCDNSHCTLRSKSQAKQWWRSRQSQNLFPRPWCTTITLPEIKAESSKSPSML